MIDREKLTESDVGRNVIYYGPNGKREVGQLSSWNEFYIFVRFNGPNGEACRATDVSFEFEAAK